ncbi:hypothetical protein V5T82_02525 [Magnetovibrio sp. PR-2]|uniref:hypothetical protein n=1 Tax=Magnetovibrio sp. PR-2 TaxID=3120356 RepID=UPI002FCE5924
MGQVVKFFGWILLGVGTALVVFGHISIIFVHGWGYLVKQVSSAPGETALWLVALVPGVLLYNLGRLIDYLGRKSDEKWEAKKRAAAKGDQSDS